MSHIIGGRLHESLVAALEIVGGAWYPPAAPALWAIDPAAVDGAALPVSLHFPVLFAAVTLAAWRRLQLDRS